MELSSFIQPVGAAPLRVTVPLDEVPPVAEVGLKLNELGTGRREARELQRDSGIS